MKHLFTISPEFSFLDQLAHGLWARADGDAAQLAAMRIFLPTRRACRMLREAFLRITEGRVLLLPRMQPLGDLDEDELIFADASVMADIPPAISPLRRRLLLAQLIQRRDAAMPMDQAVHLAEALAQFLDEAQIRRCGFNAMAGLVQKRELAQHWEETVKFLSILTDAWPQILAAEGCLDPAERRDRVMAAQGAAWQKNPPDFPIIAAGSTGSMPATADLLAVIAGLPSGAVVLPGLDQAMDEEAWQAVEESHPQHGMKNLLEVMQVERGAVKDWGAATSVNHHRSALLRETMRPAKVTEAWRHLQSATIPADAVKGLSRASFAHPQEEAQAIALMLRRALETPQQNIALVTPDRNLAERVAVLLARWEIAADDSAGASLAEQPVGSFLTALLATAAPQAGAVDWLSLLKHPYAACGLEKSECRARARQLELKVWRTDRPEISAWFDELKKKLQLLSAAWECEKPLTAWLDDHLRLAEVFAASADVSGADMLWAGEAGDGATAWIADLRAAAAQFPPVTGAVYQTLFTELLRQASYRPSYGLHPRLSILGPLEARLLRPDFVVLGGMNEGIWPPEIAVDPWMSRPMKKDFGMMAAEHRIGLSAHDFVQLAQAPQVIMTRALRSGGAPTVPSRFLLQMETVLRALGHSDKNHDALAPVEPWQEWARMLDEPLANEIKPCAPPEPKPPVELRPTQLSVTEIGTWRRNPYAIYAKHVLGLRKLDPLEAETDAADRGNLIHQALEQFVREHPVQMPADALQQLLSIGEKLFAVYDDQPDIKAFWWPRFESLTAWFVDKENERRAAGIRPVAVEAEGKLALPTSAGAFVLKGRADRIDRMADGALGIVDYKTGGVPTKQDVQSGIEPQLPLLSLMAERGAFASLAPGPAAELAYWKLGGGRGEKSNATTEFSENLATLRDEAEMGLRGLIELFADPATAYQAVPKPRIAPRFDDYAHLARLAEWGRTNED